MHYQDMLQHLAGSTSPVAITYKEKALFYCLRMNPKCILQ